MGRPPCCDKVGIKKGPWTPEEDIILVSYIQEHGPGNWRSVPTNTGLLRCSKSCRLRWTNYLRPGIKRGNFTPHEEGMIIHLQALLGNKWAAIASYLPQRTDNDIKNYWNTHLKKKLKKFQSAANLDSSVPTTSDQRSRNNVSSLHNNLSSPVSSRNATISSPSSTTYASSTENISRLLQGWMSNSSSSKTICDGNNTTASSAILGNSSLDNINNNNMKGVAVAADQEMSNGLISNEEFESILCFENLSNNNNNNNNNPPLSFLEKWLLDESNGNSQVLEEDDGEEEDEAMELSPIF